MLNAIEKYKGLILQLNRSLHHWYFKWVGPGDSATYSGGSTHGSFHKYGVVVNCLDWKALKFCCSPDQWGFQIFWVLSPLRDQFIEPTAYCTMGSYPSLSVCLSVRLSVCHWIIIHTLNITCPCVCACHWPHSKKNHVSKRPRHRCCDR